MWIGNQDATLMVNSDNVKAIYVSNKEKVNGIYAIVGDDTEILIGAFNTQEKAIEEFRNIAIKHNVNYVPICS
jgi:hypothetical protein